MGILGNTLNGGSPSGNTMGIAKMPGGNPNDAGNIAANQEDLNRIESGDQPDDSTPRQDHVQRRTQRSVSAQRSIESKFTDHIPERRQSKKKTASDQDDDPEFRAAVRIDDDIRRAIRFRMEMQAGTTINGIINSALRMELARELEIVRSPEYQRIRAIYERDMKP